MHDDATGLLDRSTLVAWRVVNLVGWTVLGILAALFFRFAGEATGALMRSGSYDLQDFLPLRYGALFGAASSLVAGAAAGTLVGGRVHRWPLGLSGVAATIAALIWWYAYAGWFSATGWVGLATAAIMVPVALLAGRRAAAVRASRYGGARSADIPRAAQSDPSRPSPRPGGDHRGDV